MSTEEKLVAVLTQNADVAAIIETRVYPLILPQGAMIPAVTYQRISGGKENSADGYSGLENPRIQVDCWGVTYAQAKDLSKKVETALGAATTFNALCISDQDDFEDSKFCYRVILDFSIWNREE